jgi:hypothetical protein
MGFVNPNNSNEILYGSSGDVRNEINAYASPAGSGHYVDEAEVPGTSIIRGLERATRRINAYLEVVYANNIPISATGNVPALLDDIASDIATYFVWRENMFRLAKMSDEKKQTYFQDHTSEDPANPGTLSLLRSRKLQLPEFSGAYTDEVKSVRSLGQAPIFDVDDEKNWEVDSRTIDDIEQERN